MLTHRDVLGGIVLHGLGAIVWLAALAKVDVSKACPLVVLGFVFTVATGCLRREHDTLPGVFGLARIRAGALRIGRN